MAVHHVHLEGAFLRDRFADVLDRLLHGGALVDGDEVRRHETAGGVLWILEDLLDLFRLLLLHQLEDLLRLLGGQLLDDVGGVLGRHLVQDPRDLDLVQRPHQLQEGVVVQLGEDVTGALRRERTEELHLGGERQLAERGGEVRGVRLIDQRQVAGIGRPLDGVLRRVEQPVGLVHRAFPVPLYLHRPGPRRLFRRSHRT